MPIRILPPEVASRIAAGEVVERPASAVKELVENSLDAGADELRVEVREGGRRLMRVVDNGHGIPAEEVPLAFQRHATSKLASAADLDLITTLGFRGEALASIASVSQLTMLTRHVSEPLGTQVRVEGGILVSQESKGSPPGTLVSVEHLFYNVPARLKFLRQPATEAGHIATAVRNLALAYPERRFSLVSEGRLAFQSTGSGRLEDVLVKVMGVEAARQMVPMGFADQRGFGQGQATQLESPDVYGYVGLPSLNRSNRSHISLFLNRRPIQDRTLTYAVIEAYRNRLMVGRYPVAVVMIDLDPAMVDVNVHPAKAEVRFRDERGVFRAVQKAVLATLNAHAPVQELRSERLSWAVPGWAERRQSLVEAGEDSQRQLLFGRPGAHAAGPSGPLAPPGSSPSLPGDDAGPLASSPSEPGESMEDAEGHGASASAGDLLPMLRVVGQMGATYIVAEGPEGMYLIDQHAAHERILFERLMAEQAGQGVAQQALLEPLAVEVGTTYAGLMAEYVDAIRAAGFDLQPFGGDSWLVRAVPAVLNRTDPRRALEEVLEAVADGKDLVGDTREAALTAAICKRAAIKGGQPLSLDEMRTLLQQLEACQNPGSCPHGRPTMLVLSTAQLEREFGRRG